MPQDEIRLDGRKTKPIAELLIVANSCQCFFVNGRDKIHYERDWSGVVGHWVAPENDARSNGIFEGFRKKSTTTRWRLGLLPRTDGRNRLSRSGEAARDRSPARFDVYPNERFAEPLFLNLELCRAATRILKVHGTMRRDVALLAEAGSMYGVWKRYPSRICKLLGQLTRRWNPRLPPRLIIDSYTDYFHHDVPPISQNQCCAIC